MTNTKEHPRIDKLLDHLFRHEAGRIVSVLTRIFGSENLDLAEDVVQDSLVEAINKWQYTGVPENPSAWLYRVAKNKALNIVNRMKFKRKFSTDVYHYLQSDLTVEPALNQLFSDAEILDDQLRMIFICCHPSISVNSQIALALKTLCGFSISEIAKSFLSTEENIHKRLVRARQKIRMGKIPFEVPQGKELEKRLPAVLETIYLLFNEGYSASTGNYMIRFELCEEAIRLTEIIATHKIFCQKGSVFALLSLMYSNASRFKSRQDQGGNLLTMAEQDRALWNEDMKSKAFSCLHEATITGEIGNYHILAAISAQHSLAPSFESTDWNSILLLYDSLVQIANSPIVKMNRTIALSKVIGVEEALHELQLIKDDPAIKFNYLFYTTEAEFFIQLNKYENAINSLVKAIGLAPMKPKLWLEKKLIFCNNQIV